MTPLEQVTEFHRAFGVATDHNDTDTMRALRADLIEEEAGETVQSLRAGDSLLTVARELADLVYVTYGTAISLGIDLDAAVTAVHRANISKLGPDGKPILREDGKVLKGPNFVRPDMTAAVNPGSATGVVYLAGPMTGCADWNFPAFHAAATELRARGYTVISPAEHGLDDTDWATCMRRGLQDMLRATAVVVLPGWEESRGAKLETDVARALGMPIHELDSLLAEMSS